MILKLLLPFFHILKIIILYLYVCVCGRGGDSDSYTYSILIHYLINLLKIHLRTYLEITLFSLSHPSCHAFSYPICSLVIHIV
jgi:hypothetical protein